MDAIAFWWLWLYEKHFYFRLIAVNRALGASRCTGNFHFKAAPRSKKTALEIVGECDGVSNGH
jgi:hypothetical protein